jgi:hypothetical protein
MSRLPLVALAVLVGLGLDTMGCIPPSQRRADSLTKVAREFNDGLRWGRDDQVMVCLSPDDARALRAHRADLGDDLVIADHEVKSIQLAPDAETATVVAEFSWFSQRRNVVKKSTVEETWTWSGNHWLVTDQRRVSGDRFPLVPERASGARDLSQGLPPP